MIVAGLLLIFHRSELLTLLTMTYTSMQESGIRFRYCLREMLGRDKE